MGKGDRFMKSVIGSLMELNLVLLLGHLFLTKDLIRAYAKVKKVEEEIEVSRQAKRVRFK